MGTDLSVDERTNTSKDWYAQPPGAVAEAFGVDPDRGLTAAAAADRLRTDGPNALPEEKTKPGWLRFLDEYRSYMQIILLVHADR
jgi:Ca2+-transporting ATPase